MLRFVAIALTTLGFWTETSSARLLDAPSATVLDRFADLLDSRGIDVRNAWGSPSSTQTRATVGPLLDYPSDVLLPERTTWTSDFAGTYEVVSRSRGAEIARASFWTDWLGTPAANRVFLSFTTQDAPEAFKVREAFKAEGYNVFLFTGNNGEVVFSGYEIRLVFDTADHHLVLDTPSARISSGIRMESILAKQLPLQSRATGLRFWQADGPRPLTGEQGSQLEWIEATRRLEVALDDERRAASIIRQAPSPEVANVLSEIVSRDSNARLNWLKLNDAGVRLAFDALAERPPSAFRFVHDVLRDPVIAAEFRLLRQVEARTSNASAPPAPRARKLAALRRSNPTLAKESHALRASLDEAGKLARARQLNAARDEAKAEVARQATEKVARTSKVIQGEAEVARAAGQISDDRAWLNVLAAEGRSFWRSIARFFRKGR